ncbi:MAG: 3-dehydroquinate synthase [Oscillospiraceae bacterium]|nr:3-dehydroquinate synthase [Oscillospiraceae bacterium]
MNSIEVNVNRPYEVQIGSGLLQDVGGHVRRLLPKVRTVAVVTDDTVGGLYLATVAASVARAGMEFCSYSIAPGEASKSGAEYLALLHWLAEAEVTRTDCILALGGGVVGDLAGLAAATYLRGVPYIQLPTTLLAMVDSSVGGKCGIDLPAGKNLAGAFYQPALVLADTDTLDTLPEAVFREGLAEVIKYGMLGSARLLDQLQGDDIMLELPSVIATCVALKRDIVEQDEFDMGQRMLLNLGHTVGHAIERLGDYTIPHGHAVAIGMAVDTRAAVRRGLCPAACLYLLESLLDRYQLPSRTAYGPEALFEAALHDKKRAGAEITIVVPCGLGQSELMTIPVASLQAWIELGVAT